MYFDANTSGFCFEILVSEVTWSENGLGIDLQLLFSLENKQKMLDWSMFLSFIRYTIFSPKDGQPCMDHDRQTGEVGF